MQIGITGAGAMGSIFAHFFLTSGLRVNIYEKNKEVCKAIQKGLDIVIGEKTITHYPLIADSPKILEECSCIFLFTKSYSTEEAAAVLSHLENKESIIISLQNGLGNYEILRKHIKPDRIVYGTTSIGASKTSPGEVKFGGTGNVTAGGKSRKNTDRVINLLTQAGINAKFTDDPEKALWQKAIINAGINPIAALLGVPNGKLIENSYSLELQDKIISEAVDVASAMGIDLMRHEMILITKEVCRNTSANTCSMLQDIRNMRKTEIDAINGQIIRFGKQNSVSTPFNESIYMLVKAQEEFFE